MNFNNQLKNQISFLERSCLAYDNGYENEAIRIAVVIRTLIHQTKKSKSLLRHLNSYNILLLSTGGISPESRSFPQHYMGLGSITFDSTGQVYRPSLNMSSTNNSVPVTEWWNQIVYVVSSIKLSRKQIILTAANKDGGAHVDSNLTPEYEALSSSGAIGNLFIGEKEDYVEFEIKDAHFVGIRQMAYELLNSPQLAAIIELPPN